MTTSLKTRTARLSVLSNSLLIILKVVVGTVTGSVSILSEAIHSSLDLVAAVIAFFAVKVSGNPADDRHPFGHGKVENVSGGHRGTADIIASAWIIDEAVGRFIHPGETEARGCGVLVMAISAVVNTIVSRSLYKVARQTESVALEADALHLKTDVITPAGVARDSPSYGSPAWHGLTPSLPFLWQS